MEMPVRAHGAAVMNPATTTDVHSVLWVEPRVRDRLARLPPNPVNRMRTSGRHAGRPASAHDSGDMPAIDEFRTPVDATLAVVAAAGGRRTWQAITLPRDGPNAPLGGHKGRGRVPVTIRRTALARQRHRRGRVMRRTGGMASGLHADPSTPLHPECPHAACCAPLGMTAQGRQDVKAPRHRVYAGRQRRGRSCEHELVRPPGGCASQRTAD